MSAFGQDDSGTKSITFVMLGAFPENLRKKKPEEIVSGEIDTGKDELNAKRNNAGMFRIDQGQEAGTEGAKAEQGDAAALKQELAETEQDLADLQTRIAKMEAAQKAPLTEGDQGSLDRKLDDVRTKYAQDPDMRDRLLKATKEAFMEGRENLSTLVKGLKQRRTDLESRKAEIEQQLGSGRAAA